MPIAAGTRLGPYEIQSALGAGGMGEVYKARDTRLDRTVAIKVLPEALASDPQFRERFDREARVISQLDHPHICALYDVGEQAGTAYLVMPYLEGETLADRLKRGALSLDEATTIAIQIAGALDAAHRRGITHRDLKPGNVMVTKGDAKVLDFGLAKVNPGAGAWGPKRGTIDRGQDLTAATDESQWPTRAVPLTAEGTILGTVHYMAPEQIEGGDVDARSDIWSFGCVVYEMLAGARPFDGRTPASVMAAILEREPASLPPTRSAIPRRLWDVIRTCLEKDPADRWQSARDLLREVQWVARDHAASTDAPPPVGRHISRRSWIALAGLLLLVGGALSAWILSTSSAAGPAGPPVIVLMDSTHPERVYDDATRKAGGTNADDLSDLLRDLPVRLVKENTNATWHRERQVLSERPDLVVAHRSCFYDATMLGAASRTPEFIALAADKFELFLAHVAQGSPRTRFLVYSRQSWPNDAARRQWIAGVEQRFPQLLGKVEAMDVPLDRATFRHPMTGAEIKKRVVTSLKLAAPK